MPNSDDENSDDNQMRRPGPESTLDEVRASLVDEGAAMLGRVGVDLGLDRIKLADVIEATGVGRSSAYRSLADPELSPQAVLHREVMTRILREATRERNREAVGIAAVAEIERQRENLDSSDPDHHLHAVRSIIRVGTEAAYEEISNSSARVILTAAYGAFRSSDRADWQLAELVASEQTITELFSEMYVALSQLVGYRLRPGMTVDHFSTAAAGLVEGLAMRHGVSDLLGPIQRPTGLNGELEEWSVYSAAFEAMYMMWFERDPSVND